MPSKVEPSLDISVIGWSLLRFVGGDYRLSDEQLEVESKKRKIFPTALEQGWVPGNMSVATAESHVYMRN